MILLRAPFTLPKPPFLSSRCRLGRSPRGPSPALSQPPGPGREGQANPSREPEVRTTLHPSDNPLPAPAGCALARHGAGALPSPVTSLLARAPLSARQRVTSRGVGGCRGDASPPRFKHRLRGPAALPLTAAKMAAAASDLLTGWCLFGLALLVRGGSPALRRAPQTSLPSPPLPSLSLCRLLLLLRPLAVPVLGILPALLARTPEPVPAASGSPRLSGVPWRWCHGAEQSPELGTGGCLALLPDGPSCLCFRVFRV